MLNDHSRIASGTRCQERLSSHKAQPQCGRKDGHAGDHSANYLDEVIAWKNTSEVVEFRTIPGYEGLYEASRDGQVRSLIHGNSRNYAPALLRGFTAAGGEHSYWLESRKPVTKSGRRHPHGIRGRRAERTVHTAAELVEITYGDRRKRAKAPADIAGIDPRVVADIRLQWSRRQLRRYASVTVEILADIFRLKKTEIRAIVRDVEMLK